MQEKIFYFRFGNTDVDGVEIPFIPFVGEKSDGSFLTAGNQKTVPGSDFTAMGTCPDDAVPGSYIAEQETGQMIERFSLLPPETAKNDGSCSGCFHETVFLYEP